MLRSFAERSHLRSVLTFGLTFALCGVADGGCLLIAHPLIAPHSSQVQGLESVEFEPPNDGAPGRRQDAGSRPFCPQTETPFTALAPVTNLGLTAAARPTFWLYTPHPSGKVEFVLRDENTKDVLYQTQFQTTAGPGIVSFRLPDNAPPLEIDKKYRWTFDFLCNPSNSSDSLSVTGVVMRQALSSTLGEQLKTASFWERIDLYAQHGLWHETLTELAQLHFTHPQHTELTALWTALLQHPWVRLPEIVHAAYALIDLPDASSPIPKGLTSQPTQIQQSVSRKSAEQLLEQAYQQAENGQLERAIATFHQALNLARQIQARDLEATALMAIGDFSNTLGQPLTAIDFLNQALLLFEELEDTAGQATVLHDLGWAYQTINQPEQAIGYYQAALPLLQAAGNSLGLAATLNNLGDLYNDLEQPQEALAHYNQALPTVQTLGDIALEAHTLISLGKTYRITGRLSMALPVYQQALQIHREIGDLEGEAGTLSVLGAIYQDLGQPEQAQESYQQALSLVKTIGDRAWEAEILSSLGSIYRATGQLSRALPVHQQSLQISREIGDRDMEADSLNSLGLVFRALGQPQQALGSYRQALSIAQEIGYQYGIANILGNLGILYFEDLGEAQQALTALNQTLQIHQEFGDRADVARSLNNLGGLYLSMGQLQQALSYYQQALPVAQALGRLDMEATIMNNVGAIFLQLGQSQQALNYLNQALPLVQATDDAVREAILLHNFGRGLWRSGDLVAAQDKLFASIQIFESLQVGLSDANQVSFFETQLDTYHTLQQVLIAQNQPEQALEIAERGRARAFVTLLAQRLATNSDEIPEVAPPSIQQVRHIARTQNATLVEYSIVSENDLLIWVISPTGQVTFRQVNLSSLDSPISDWVADTRQQIGVRNRGDMPAVIAYAPGDLVRLNTDAPDYEPWQVVAVNAAENTLSLTQSSLPDDVTIERPATDVIAKVESRRTYQPRLQQLHQLLIEPIADALPSDPNAHVIFIPHQALFLVPFAALQDAEGNYLIEQHTILTAPAIQVLDFTHDIRRQLDDGESRNKTNALIVGNPTMPTVSLAPGQMPQPLAPLPNAEVEARAIAELWQTQAKIGDQATESAIVAQMPQSDIIHLATHGLIDEVEGFGSAIALAPSQTASLQGTVEDTDGLLTATEILDMQLQAELVVLSACNTGRGRITGDGVIGLSRSFISAGVPSIVVSLWTVPDAPTAELMTQFYQNLQRNSDKAQALRQAILTLIEDHPDPRDWAAFTLVGEAM